MLTLLFLFASVAGLSEAFVPKVLQLQQQQNVPFSALSAPRYAIPIDPQLVLNSAAFANSGVADMTSLVAVASAAAAGAATGALSQQPRIRQLQLELETAKQALNETSVEMQDKMHALEDKLFVMDQEYEAQTARFKKQYDTQMKEELERTTEKIKQDYEFKLDLRVNEVRSNMLSQQLDKVNGGVDREAQLSQLRIQKDRMEEANRKLEKALKDSEKELERMREAASKKQKLFGLF